MAGFTIELAEPGNHRSIGKVERVIGMAQNIIRKYNLLLNERFTDKWEIDKAWRTLEILAPMINMAFNQRRSRISQISPNMLIYGRNMYQPLQLNRIIQKFKETQDDPNLKLKKDEYDYYMDLFTKVKDLFNIYANDWMHQAWVTRKHYNNRNNITKEKILRNKIKFDIGTKILYYCGDIQVSQSKWRIKWTGPWVVDKHISDSSLIIADPTTGNQKRVSFDRIKLFVDNKHIRFDQFLTQNKEYKLYQQQLFDRYQNYKVNMRKRHIDLDYTKHRM